MSDTIITIRCKPEDFEGELSKRHSSMWKSFETTPGWHKSVAPNFSLQSVVDTPGCEKIHYVNVKYKA